MPHIKHPKLQNTAFVLKKLQRQSRSELAAELGVGYNSVNHQVRTKMTEEQKGTIVRKRFSFTDTEKLGFLKEAEQTSVSEVSRRHGISRTQLQHWKKILYEKKLLKVGPKTKVPKVEAVKAPPAKKRSSKKTTA